MDAIASARVSEFMSSYVTSDYLDPSSDPQHRPVLESSLAELRLVSDDLAQVDSMLDEIAGQRAFMQAMTARIQDAEAHGQDTYLLKWDRGYAGAKVRDLQDRVSALLGTSLDARLASSRETFRLNYLASGALGRTLDWAGDGPAIQDALDGLLIPESTQTVVNHYLYSIGNLQRDIASLSQALSTGGALASSPKRSSYALTLASWQVQVASLAGTVQGMLAGTEDISRLDPVPWSDRQGITTASRPPTMPSARREFQLAEDAACLARLQQQARSLEAALAAQVPQRGRPGAGELTSGEAQAQSQRHEGQRQKARLTSDCIQALRTRMDMVRKTPSYGDGTLRPADLDVAEAQRRLATLDSRIPNSNTPTAPSPDEATYKEALPFFQGQQAQLQQSRQSLSGSIERLTYALAVPRGFRLSEGQQAELALLWSQRAALEAQQELLQKEQDCLKAVIERVKLGERRGDPFDYTGIGQLQTAWESAKAARLQGEDTQHGALSTPPPTFVAWKQSQRSSSSRAMTVTRNYLLSPEVNAAVRVQINEDQRTSAELRGRVRTRDAAIEAAEARLGQLTRQGATAAEKADQPSVQAQLKALKSLRAAEVGRLLLVEQRLSANDALRTSSSEQEIGQRQEAVESAGSSLPTAWLDQLRAERVLAQAELTLAQRSLAKLESAVGTPNTTRKEAERIRDYREQANTYAAARVTAQEAQRANSGQATAALQALAQAKEGMQAAYYDLVQLRLVYRIDGMRSQLRTEQANGASVNALIRLQKELSAAEADWPRNLSPYPATSTEKAAAVQARFGDGLPE